MLPILPSLLAEAKGGWDLKLATKTGVVLFVQFKVPFACTRSNALEWGLYGGTYYRLYIRRRSHSRQHNRLRRLSQRQRYVYYLAPRFYKLTSCNQRYLDTRVLAESAAFPLRSLPSLVDDNQHYVCYKTGSDARWFSEEPVEVKAEGQDALLRSLAAAVIEHAMPFTKDGLMTIREDLLVTLEESKLSAAHPNVRGFDDIVRDIIFLGRTYLNAEPIFLTSTE
jgi:hypothetical protein